MKNKMKRTEAMTDKNVGNIKMKQKMNEQISTIGENNIKGIKNYWAYNTQLGCFFAYFVTEDKKVNFSSLDFANIKKENIFTVTIIPTDNQKKKIDYRLLDDKIEWEDEADEFFVVIVGKV